VAKNVTWMKVVIECTACRKTSPVVLGTKTKEEKPIAKCPACKSDQIKITSVTPAEGVA
jgi:Zn finger protein HypA/HybF involved in hydrogenase expression